MNQVSTHEIGRQMLILLWNLAGSSAAMLPRCLPKFRVIGKFLTLMSSLRDFAKSCDNTLPPFGTVHIWNYTHRGVILTGKQVNFQCCTHLWCHSSVYQIVIFVWHIFCFRVWTQNKRIWCTSETGSTTRTLSHWSEKKAPPLARWSTNRWVFIDVPLFVFLSELDLFLFDALYLTPFLRLE